ncbi:unnamed protein product [Rotaria sordida]|uniref:Uncharacterized protein n=1 Tax=Rotaria sordida TaxID=392033 RepID=A0A815TDW7_9BILA|nr:unnamed protein product [Rotaria sordida]CAF1503853.1 unnamed protein product [Rotaria sordida]
MVFVVLVLIIKAKQIHEGGQYNPPYPLLTVINSLFNALLIDSNINPSFFNTYPNRHNVHIIHDFICPFNGYSLSPLSNLLKSFNYIHVEVDFWNIIYIQCQIVESIQIQIPANDDITC